MKRDVKTVITACLAAVCGALPVLLLRVRGNTLFDYLNLALLLHWVPLLMMLAWARSKCPACEEHFASRRRLLPLACLCGAMVLFVFSSIVRHRWFYFLRWLPGAAQWHGPHSLAWWFVIITAFWLPVTLWRPRRSANVLWILLIVGQLAALAGLLRVTGGVFLGRDDHPSFVFRLWEFRETFPWFLSYNPWWNAGKVGMSPLVTGTLGPGLLLWPFLRFFPVEQVYTPGIGLLFIVVVPVMAALSVRAIRGNLIAQAAAAILAMGVSQHYFLWLLNYGTIGACFNAAMIMPVSALLYRMVVQRRTDAYAAVALTLAMVWLLLYPPGFLVSLPLGLSLLLQWRRWNRRLWLMLAVCASVVLLAHARTLLLLLADVDFRAVTDSARPAFLYTPRVGAWSREALVDGWNLLLAHLREGHPALIYLGLLGLLFTPHRRLCSWYLPLIAGLAWMCGWGRFYAPHLQLSRMAIPMLFAAVVPAALHVGDVLRTRGASWALWRSALIAMLAMTALNNVRMFKMQGRAPAHAFTSVNLDMAAWIREKTPPAARVLFAGETVHGFGGGHVAVFPLLTGRAMMASDYYHFDPRQVEYEFPPRPFRDTIEGWQEYLEMYNVSTVLTFHERWKRFFDNHPDVFTPAAAWYRNDWIKAYRVQRDCNANVWRGAGRAEAHFNRITVVAEAGQEEIVLGYHWDRRLVVDSPAEIFPYEIERGKALIGVRPAGLSDITISFRPR